MACLRQELRSVRDLSKIIWKSVGKFTDSQLFFTGFTTVLCCNFISRSSCFSYLISPFIALSLRLSMLENLKLFGFLLILEVFIFCKYITLMFALLMLSSLNIIKILDTLFKNQILYCFLFNLTSTKIKRQLQSFIAVLLESKK